MVFRWKNCLTAATNSFCGFRYQSSKIVVTVVVYVFRIMSFGIVLPNTIRIFLWEKYIPFDITNKTFLHYVIDSSSFQEYNVFKIVFHLLSTFFNIGNYCFFIIASKFFVYFRLELSPIFLNNYFYVSTFIVRKLLRCFSIEFRKHFFIVRPTAIRYHIV